MTKVKRNLWRSVFLGATGLAIAMEVFAAVDGNPSTEPWTSLIVQYVPAEVTFLAIGGLTTWLFIHFGKRYAKRKWK